MPSPTRPDQVTRRKPPAERRREILEVTGRLELESGMEAVTYRTVAAQLECAQGLIYHYFPVVDGLVAEAFEALIRDDLDRTFAKFDAAADPGQGFQRLFSEWFDPSPTAFGRLWLDAWSQARHRAAIRDAVQRSMDAGHQEVSQRIRAAVSSGHATSSDPVADAWTLLTLLDGMIVHSSLAVDSGGVDATATMHQFARELLGIA